MKWFLGLVVAALVSVSIVMEGIVASIAELAAFISLVVWAVKSKFAVKREDEIQPIEPHL
ncbi:MAG: hypothetical protein ACK5NC_09930 [Vibrio sp.]